MACEYDEDVLFPVQSASSEDFTHEEAQFLIDLMVWSFSRLNSFGHCPHEWKMHYLCGQYGMGSAMAQFGSFVHHILEMYLKGELDLFELPIYYDDHYAENVTLSFPHNNYVDLADKYYHQGLEYFENFDWDLSDYDILGVEKEVRFEYQGYQFVGYIDVLLRDKRDGKLVICDHKSSTLKFLKNGNISKTDIAHFEEFKKQLLIYSHAVMQEYGEGSVKALQWNLFRLGKIYTIPWSKREYEEAMKWAVDTIAQIRAETEWRPAPSAFYCRELCSQRNNACLYKE